MKSNWIVSPREPELQKKLSVKLSISPLTAQILINRGIRNDAEAEAFLKCNLFDLPSPYLMSGMDKAVSRLSRAVYGKEKIAIYGDYDVDGITSTSLLYNFLAETGSDVTCYNPERLTEGYGINSEAVKYLADQGVTLIVSGDCGITAYDEVEEAKKLGVDFIITDHHKPPERIPRAVAVLNPHLDGCRYPGKEITGVGVIFNLVIALRRDLREKGFFREYEPNLGDYLDLVALGTVADCAPLVNVNRIFVKEGLKRMHDPKRIGIRALKEASGIGKDISSGDLGFRLGPRINAAGRIDSARSAVELFTTSDIEDARRIASVLNEQNSRRQGIERRILDEAFQMIENNPYYQDASSLVLSSESWHPGVIGIVASRIVEKYSKPVFLIAVDGDGVGKGSGRGLEGINLYETLSGMSELFTQFGGHELAAGITIHQDNIDRFRKRLDSVTGALGDVFARKIRIDFEVELDEIDQGLVSELGTLEPFGLGNPQPLILARSVEVVSKRFFKDRHLGLKLRKSKKVYDAVWFNSSVDDIGDVVDVVFVPELNRWNGREDLRLTVRDLSY